MEVGAYRRRLRDVDPTADIVVTSDDRGRTCTVLLRTQRFGVERAGVCEPDDLSLLLDSSTTHLIVRLEAAP